MSVASACRKLSLTCTYYIFCGCARRACPTSVVMWDENFLYLQIENGLYRRLRCRYYRHLAFFIFSICPGCIEQMMNQRSNGRWRSACHHQNHHLIDGPWARLSLFVFFLFANEQCDGPMIYENDDYILVNKATSLQTIFSTRHMFRSSVNKWYVHISHHILWISDCYCWGTVIWRAMLVYCWTV